MYPNIVCFILITIVYYYVAHYQVPNRTEQPSNKHWWLLFGYLIANIVSQFGINIGVAAGTCNISLNDAASIAAKTTIVPWFIMLGSVIILLISFPRLISIFADIIGYYVVASKANNLIPQIFKSSDDKSKELLEKLYGNPSLLINQIVPATFDTYWNMMGPIKANDTDENKTAFYNIIYTRIAIGEIVWYFYMGLIIISIVQMQIVSSGCNSSAASMQKKYNDFLANNNDK